MLDELNIENGKEYRNITARFEIKDYEKIVSISDGMKLKPAALVREITLKIINNMKGSSNA